jgi:hypothetical protein
MIIRFIDDFSLVHPIANDAAILARKHGGPIVEALPPIE